MRCIWEHNGCDTLLYAADYPGAYTRGKSLDEAIGKMRQEMASYTRWCKAPMPMALDVDIIQEKRSDLCIADADSDVLFDAERNSLTMEEYQQLKALALQSAEDFHRLFMAVPDRDASCLPHRSTFYGAVPRTAQEMYAHTRSVNAYYFGEIGVEADNEGTIQACRQRGFDLLEKTEGFLEKTAVEGSYGEWWSLRKVLRRFLWHDRIHARAMYRMAVKTFGEECVNNVFMF